MFAPLISPWVSANRPLRLTDCGPCLMQPEAAR